jgi:hypothetical protein
MGQTAPDPKARITQALPHSNEVVQKYYFIHKILNLSTYIKQLKNLNRCPQEIHAPQN